MRPLVLLPFATYSVIPIHKCSVGILPPGPDVQFKECWKSIPIRAVHQLERLPFEYRRTVMACEPGRSIDYKLDTDQAESISLPVHRSTLQVAKHRFLRLLPVRH